MKSRNQSISTLCALALAAFAAFAQEARGVRPNVVLILIDDMGSADSTAYGSTYCETPNLERLAAEGMLFTAAYAAPLCSPTRASIMSGQHPARLRLTQAITGNDVAEPQSLPPTDGKYCGNVNNRDRMPLGIETLADVLKDAGYLTAHIGKWHLAPKGDDIGYYAAPRGFDFVIGGDDAPGPGGYYSPYNIPNLPPGPEGEYLNERLAQEAINWIGSVRNAGQPFYLNFWHYAVHSPIIAKKELLQKYEDKDDPRGLDCPEMGTMVESMDNSVGMLLDWLDRPENLGLKTNTVVVLVSDNGGVIHKLAMEDGSQKQPTSNRPLRAGKGSTYDGGMRVPWIVRWPGQVEAGALCRMPVGTVDLYPTVLDIAGVAAPAGQPLDGRSVLPLFRGEAMADHPQFSHFPHLFGILCAPSTAVRLGDYKLIRFYWAGTDAASHYHELYDLENDPWESVNLAVHRPGKVAELSALLDGFLQDTDALVPLRNMAFTGNPRTSRSGSPANAPRRPLSIRLPEPSMMATAGRGSREIQLLDQTGNWCETAAVVVEGGEWVWVVNHPDGRAELFWDGALQTGPAKVLFGWSGGLNPYELNDWTMDACELVVNPSAGAHTTLFNWKGGGANSSWGTAANWDSLPVLPVFDNAADLVWNSAIAGVYSYVGESRAARSLTFGSGFDIGAGNVSYTVRLRTGPTDGAATLSLQETPSIAVAPGTGAGKDLKTIFIGNNSGMVDIRNGDLQIGQHSTNVLLSFNASVKQTGGTCGIAKHGAGALELYRANTMAGDLRILGGTAIVRNVATAAGAGAIQLGAPDDPAAAVLQVSGTPSLPQTFANDIVVRAGGDRTIRNYSNGGIPTLGGHMTLERDAIFDVAIHALDTQDKIIVGGRVGGSGGIVKQGQGTLVLSGTNEFNGNLTVGGGAVVLSSGGSVQFLIGAKGVNGKLAGTGAAGLEGKFLFDLSSAGTTPGDFWTIVEPTAAATYGADFGVDGFGDAGGGIWTNAIGPGRWHEFNQATGVLRVWPTQMATHIYDAGGTDKRLWSDASNWDGDLPPAYGSHADLVFDVALGNNAMRIGANRTVHSLTFGANLYGSNGATIDLLTVNDAANAARTLTLDSGSGPAAITVEDGFGVANAQIRFGSSGTPAGNVVLNSNVDLHVNDGRAPFIFNSVTSGPGAIHKYGVGTAAVVRANTFAGGIHIHQGTLAAYSAATALGSGLVTLGGEGSAADAYLAVGSNQTRNNRIVVGSGSGGRIIGNLGSPAAAVGNPVLGGAITLDHPVVFAIAGYSNTHDRITVTGAISGDYGVEKMGGGTLVLAGTNTYRGATKLVEGALVLAGRETINDLAPLVLGAGTLFHMDFEGVETVGGLSLDGGATWLSNGTYDASALGNLGAGTCGGGGSVNVVAIGDAILQVLAGGSGLAMGWQSAVGLSYAVESTTNLFLGEWKPVASNLAGTGGSLGYTGEVSAAEGFFRIVVE